uniref:hypothetical protein n=1 Tax=Pulvinaster venetus TaxID=427767 RepID=UPI001FCD9D54|nr:hypothetical protein MW436_pgp172 [Pulvinaster venetus]UNJ16887.1 hypothetical protein [Pulvinaster venetus]
MTILIIGATGTLGRQIVREALNEGYQVKCLVRNLRKASFLKEWGAELIYGDLSIPETLPLALYNTNVIIDAATARPSDTYNIDTIDYKGKKILIDAAQQANIKRFVFCSLKSADNTLYNRIPLVQLKVSIEEYLKQSGINHTIFRLEGFFQGLINQYAIPILENQPVWITKESKPIAYIDTQDASKFIIKSLYLSKTENQTFDLIGQKAWTSIDIIKLCEKLSGKKAKINYISITFLRILKQITKLFEWTWNISDRLAFIEILSTKEIIPESKSIPEIYNIFNFNISDNNSLEKYLQEYFNKILKKIKELNYDPKNNISTF